MHLAVGSVFCLLAIILCKRLVSPTGLAAFAGDSIKRLIDWLIG